MSYIMQAHFGKVWEMARGPARASDDVQMTFRLPKALYDELKAAGNVSEAARERLEAASNDEQTRQLQRAITNLASILGTSFGPWHEDPFSWLVMHSAINTLLDARRPEGDPVQRATGAVGDDPATYGRAMALALSELRR
jgi:hypothetical protein